MITAHNNKGEKRALFTITRLKLHTYVTIKKFFHSNKCFVNNKVRKNLIDGIHIRFVFYTSYTLLGVSKKNITSIT